MPKENLIYNFNGDMYWEIMFNEESGKLNIYEGKHGHYVGLVVRFEAGVTFGSGYAEYSEYKSYEEFKADYDRTVVGDSGFTQEIINLHDGIYIGEILSGRLIVNEQKLQKRKVKENIFYRPFGRMGYLCQPKMPKLDIPKGYHDFEVV